MRNEILIAVVATTLASCATRPTNHILFEMQAWGAPWTRRVDLTAFEDGQVHVTAVDPNKHLRKKKTVTFTLADSELVIVRDAAHAAISSCDDAKRQQTTVMDATRVRLVLYEPDKTSECMLRAAGRAEAASSEFSRLIKALNAHLSEEDEIW